MCACSRENNPAPNLATLLQGAASTPAVVIDSSPSPGGRGHAQRRRLRARSAPRGRPWEISAPPTSRTTRSGSSGPSAPLAAGPPISPPSSAAPRGPPGSPRTRSASTNSPGAPPGRPPAPSTGRPRRSTGCARSPSTGAGSIPCLASPTASARIPPARASSSTPNTSPSAPTCPPRGRTSSTSPTTPAGASRRSSASPGRRLTWPVASSGSRRLARRRWWGASSPSRRPSPRPWRDGGRAATPTARWSSTATASPSGAGAPHGAPPARPPGCRPASSTIARRTAARNLIRANVPERVALLLTGHKSRATANIIHEQELLDAGDQLVAYLAPPVPARRRPHAVGTARRCAAARAQATRPGRPAISTSGSPTGRLGSRRRCGSPGRRRPTRQRYLRSRCQPVGSPARGRHAPVGALRLAPRPRAAAAGPRSLPLAHLPDV